MVAKHQPLRCLVPLLTRPEYVRIDSAVGPALVANTVCASLDDLVRHMPATLVAQPIRAFAAALRVRSLHLWSLAGMI
jgi:hypothetical protein